MKSYLSRFTVPAAEAPRNFEKALSREPPKPPKPGFDGFGGSGHKTFSNFQPSVTSADEACPSCGSPLEMAETARHRHTWCADPECVGFDRWEATDGGTLSGAFGEPTGRQMMAAAIAGGSCPECQGALDLLDRERNVWRCAGCQITFHAMTQ